MAPRCTVCDHPERASIDALLVADRTSLRDIAGQYAVSKSAVDRHKAEHLPARLVKAQEATDVRSALDVVTQLQAINVATLEILRDARALRQPQVALAAIDRVHRQIELQAKLIGLLQQEGTTTNITISPQWLEIRAVIVQALTAYPEARAAVSQALLEVDDARR